MPRPLPPDSAAALKRIRPRIKRAIARGDVDAAVDLLRALRKAFGKEISHFRLLRESLRVFDACLDVNYVQFAESGLIGVRSQAGHNTRLYVEATALLSICYIRMRKHDEAKPLVRETMMNLNNIITDSRRRQFHLRYITRLEDECIIAELISESSKPLDRKEVEIAAINLIRDSSDEKILELLSTGISPSTILRLQQVREYLSKEITRPSDIRALPAPADGLSRSKSGNRMIKIFGRVCWKTLCAEDSPIFKAWNGLLPERFSTAFLQEQ